MQRIDQRSAKAGEGIFHFWRDDRMNFAQHQTIALQAAEGLSQHFLRNSTNGSAQFRVALGPIRQDLNDKRGPFVRDPIQDNT